MLANWLQGREKLGGGHYWDVKIFRILLYHVTSLSSIQNMKILETIAKD